MEQIAKQCCGISLFRQFHNYMGQNPEQPDLILKLAQLQELDQKTYRGYFLSKLYYLTIIKFGVVFT